MLLISSKNRIVKLNKQARLDNLATWSTKSPSSSYTSASHLTLLSDTIIHMFYRMTCSIYIIGEFLWPRCCHILRNSWKTHLKFFDKSVLRSSPILSINILTLLDLSVIYHENHVRLSDVVNIKVKFLGIFLKYKCFEIELEDYTNPITSGSTIVHPEKANCIDVNLISLRLVKTHEPHFTKSKLRRLVIKKATI